MVYDRRFLIREMAVRDISIQYVGSLLGFFWTFLNPLIMIFILWVVFSVGFKVTPLSHAPFVVWLTAGMAIWITFTQIISGSTGVIVNNPHLVKKVVFPVGILPVTKLASACITHLVFLLVLVGLMLLYGMPVSLYWFQIVYYFAAMSALALGLSWMFSSIQVFVRDMSQIVGVMLQFGFWATPIFWDLGMMPERLRWIFQLNPMFYVVQGYRDSFIEFIPFWQHPGMTIYFWGSTALIVAAGATVFTRLRPHFADVL